MPLNEANVEGMLRELALRLGSRFEVEFDVALCMDKLGQGPVGHDAIYRTVFGQLLDGEDTPIIGEMENTSWTRIPAFLEMFPNGKALLIIRDLRDVLVSFKKLTFAPGSDYLIALFDAIHAMDHFVRYQKEYPDRFCGIRFEELKADPEKTARDWCDFLDLEFEEGMLNEDNWVEFHGNGWRPWENRKTSIFDKVAKHQNPVGRWRDLIEPDDLFLCEWLGKKQMEALGIEREGPEVSREVFDLALEKLMSSELLRDAFRTWSITGSGVQKYPLDPLKSDNWDRNYIANKDLLKGE